MGERNNASFLFCIIKAYILKIQMKMNKYDT